MEPTFSRPIERIASSVRDNRRRGAPVPGCDCVQCFGYCQHDNDHATRARMERAGQAHREREEVRDA